MFFALVATGADFQTQADLLLDHEVAAPGQTILAGVRLQMPEGWHTYWKNPGDSGMATDIQWRLPRGLTAGDIQWPVPEKHDFEGFVTYVFHQEVVLRVPLTIGADAPLGPAEIRATVKWLECKETCIPGQGEVAAALTLAREPRKSANASILEDAAQRLPARSDGLKVAAHWQDGDSPDERRLLVSATAPPGVTLADFFPHPDQSVEIGAVTEIVSATDSAISLRKTVMRFGEAAWPQSLAGILTTKPGAAVPAYEVATPIETGTLAAEVEPAVGAGSAGRATSTPAAPVTFGRMLLYAFIGGLILNIMPCVLPVIALKILGFVQQSKEAPGRVRMHGVVHTLGVLVSFLGIGIIAALLNLAYGQQFQDARFLVLLCVLMTLVSLNLFGVFEVVLGGGALTVASSAASQGGYAGTFFNGFLATILATSCSAPILGTALGFALKAGQAPWVTVFFFVTIGAGMALPYLLLSLQPRWLKVLPKPGTWMERFKVFMGFPMLATAVWLFTLAADRFDENGPLWLGIFLVLVSLAAWIFGQFYQRGVNRRGLALATALGVLVAGYAYALESQLKWRGDRAAAAAPGTVVTAAGLTWSPWSHEAIAEAQAAGRPVLVDFTADWCVTCQVNKKTSIEIESVAAKLKEINAVTLRADWTRSDDRIRSELEAFGRGGVPMVLIYSANPKEPPQLLPELLTPGIVLEALTRAAASSR